MSTRQKKTAALWVISSILCIALGNTPTTRASASTAATPAPAAAASAKESAEAQSAAKTETVEETAPSAPKRTIRRIKASEMTVPVVKKARQIINEHYKKPFGTEIEFEIEGKRYVGRIEPHYHPPGGELRPWGHHAGCSLYVVETT